MNPRQTKYLIIVLILAIIGGALIAISRAALPVGAIEAESGNVAGNAQKIPESTASSGESVRFGSQTASNGRSIKGLPLYVRRGGDFSGRPAAIYDYQVGKWYGNWIGNVRDEVNTLVTAGASAAQLPLLVAYNIPGRDCGSYSSGGAGNSANYRAWIREFAAGVGNRKAIVILEPDALAQVDCLSANDQNARIADIAYAVDHFKATTQASVYVDGGTFGWRTASFMAGLLKRAAVANAAGFSLNVSNFKLTTDSTAYGDQIVQSLTSAGVPGSRFIIDTSRNGRGPAPDAPLSWCNPDGRGLGKRPTTTQITGSNTDAYLWIKTIGESDGECGRGNPPAGQWFPAYADMLIRNAVY